MVPIAPPIAVTKVAAASQIVGDGCEGDLVQVPVFHAGSRAEYGSGSRPRLQRLMTKTNSLSLVSLHDASWTIRIRERDQEWPIGWWCWMPSAVWRAREEKAEYRWPSQTRPGTELR